MEINMPGQAWIMVLDRADLDQIDTENNLNPQFSFITNLQKDKQFFSYSDPVFSTFYIDFKGDLKLSSLNLNNNQTSFDLKNDVKCSKIKSLQDNKEKALLTGLIKYWICMDDMRLGNSFKIETCVSHYIKVPQPQIKKQIKARAGTET